jgi:ABC-type Fe3+-hydroxamate transport system substrate-binding protein
MKGFLYGTPFFMTETKTHIDQLGRKVDVIKHPRRIVSLVPSQTELLFDLGLADRVVGITKFCVHPQEWFRTKTRVGGTKKLHFNVIRSIAPDLVIANKEENNQADIERLEKEFPVWVSDVNDLASALEMIRSVGELTNTDASKLMKEIDLGFNKLQGITPKRKTLYLIWKKPYMAAGSDTFINDMMQRCGLENAVLECRYPELTEDAIVALNPELILLSSEPFPFSEKHISELQQLLPLTSIKLVDGEMFSWYGSRLRSAPSYFKTSVL